MVHIFDIDYTIIKKPGAWYFLREALAQGVIRFKQVQSLPFEWLRYKVGRPNMDFIEDTVKHLAGIEKAALENVAESCFARRLKPDIYSGAARLIKDLQQQGEPVIFATSSLDILIRPLEHFFGVSGSVCGVLEFADGKTTGHLAGNSAYGAKKKEAVQAWLEQRNIKPEDVRFYSDSYTDLPLLEYCGSPVAVNPDRFLAAKAKKRGWEMLRFRETLG
ncbi:MAG: HAD-IB family hydrolase [Treponema sp.]|nr:HAD-IB family hydrolase [Treponema sp.]